MRPRIRILSLLAGAREATGATVIIDVFRGLSLVPWALARGAMAVLPVRTEAEALALRDRYPGSLIAGGMGGPFLASTSVIPRRRSAGTT